MTKDGFIRGYMDQKEKFTENVAAKKGAELLYTLGTERIFPGRFPEHRLYSCNGSVLWRHRLYVVQRIGSDQRG